MLEESETIYCDICAQNGKTSKIKVYQINFDEATKICENEKCTYPFGLRKSAAGTIINRKYTDIANLTKKKDVSHQQQQLSATKNYLAQASARNFRMPQPKPGKLTAINKILAPYVPGRFSILERKTVEPPKSLTIQKIDVALTETENQGSVEQKSCLNVSTVSGVSQEDVSNILKDDKLFKWQSLGDELIYPQWQNKDALCWLDVVMCLFVHSKTLERFIDIQKNLSPSVLVTLVKAYKQALFLFNSSSQKTISATKQVLYKDQLNDVMQKCSVEQMEVDKSCVTRAKLPVCKEVVGDFKRLSVDEDKVKTGAGFQVIDSDFLSIVVAHGDTRYSRGLEILQNVRESTWKSIQPKLRCRKGQNDSPVFAIPLLIKDNKHVEKLFNMSYSFTLKCKHCGHTKTDHYDKVLPTFPNTSREFQMAAPSFMRPCFHCEKPNQQRFMVYEKLSEIVMLYFVEGLPHNNFEKLSFSFQGNQYAVTGLIQYRNDPDHFVAWIKDPLENLWMECDDLKSPITTYQESKPDLPANQIHVVMWEIQKCDNLANLSSEIKRHQSKASSATNIKSNQLAGKGKTESSIIQSNVSMDKVGNGIPENMNICEQKTGLVGSKLLLTLNPSGHLVPVQPQGLDGNSTVCPISLVPQGYVHNNVNIQIAQNAKSVSADQNKLAQNLPNQINKNTKEPSVAGKGINLMTSNPIAQNVAYTSHAKLTNPNTIRDNLLSKTKTNVSFLRSIKQRRAKQELEARNAIPENSIKPVAKMNGHSCAQSSQLKSSASESSFFCKIPAANSQVSSGSNAFSLKGKIFEGYKSKVIEDRLSSRASSPVSISSSSRCSSPALSTSSDGVVVQKRKTEVSEKNSKTKRRKSAVQENYSLDITDNDSSCRKDDSSVSDLNSECQVLQGLYSALNISLPDKSLPLSDVPISSTDGQSNNDLPEVLELTHYINNEENCMTNIDDFLAQL